MFHSYPPCQDESNDMSVLPDRLDAELKKKRRANPGQPKSYLISISYIVKQIDK